MTSAPRDASEGREAPVGRLVLAGAVLGFLAGAAAVLVPRGVLRFAVVLLAGASMGLVVRVWQLTPE